LIGFAPMIRMLCLRRNVLISMRGLWGLLAIVLWVAFFSILVVANRGQQSKSEGVERGLWEKEFEVARDKKKKKKKHRRPTAVNSKGSLIGLTVWRLRQPSKESDTGKPRLLIHSTEGNADGFSAERVQANTLFKDGDRIRIGIESLDDGYLYVVDREVYANGDLGEPYLIFPTRQIKGGDNLVFAGKIVEIPAQTDRPPYFRLRRSREDQVGERLTIIVSRRRLNVPLAYERMRLDPKQVAKWEKAWGGPAQRLESTATLGRGWTVAEKDAGEGKRLLEHGDPMPQTIYRPDRRKGTALVVVSLGMSDG
jgi:Domain of unknown function (DUF4384)